MNIHNKKVSKSINLNIVGTANVVTACEKLNVKIIYMSTSYVYEGKKEIIKKPIQFCLGIIMPGRN